MMANAISNTYEDAAKSDSQLRCLSIMTYTDIFILVLDV